MICREIIELPEHPDRKTTERATTATIDIPSYLPTSSPHKSVHPSIHPSIQSQHRKACPRDIVKGGAVALQSPSTFVIAVMIVIILILILPFSFW